MVELPMKQGIRIVALAAVLLGAGCTPLDNAMAAVFGRSMRSQPSIGTYEQPLAPPVGSVAFSSGNYPTGPGEVNLGEPDGTAAPAPITKEQVAQAMLNPGNFPEIIGLVNPVEATAASLARGEVLFNRACAPCHGSTGVGDGPVTRVAPALSRPINIPSVAALSDGYIYSMIRVGRGLMPQYGHQISHYDRWHVVNYLRQLQGP
jgi:mono/diheme cytochrome c family protein